MKKILSLVLVLSLVLGSFSFSFANPADELSAEAAGEMLRELELLTGDKGNLMLDKNLKRQDMMVVVARLLGAYEEAQTFPSSTKFEDVRGDYYKSIIGWSDFKGLTTGYGDGKTFGFDDELQLRHTITFLLRALGYETEYAWDNHETLGQELLLVSENADLRTVTNRGVMAQLMVNALYAPMADGEMSLGTFLGFEGFELEEEEPVVEELEVVSVSAINARQVEVKFNKAVDADTITANNVRVFIGSATTATTWTRALSDDGMTLILGLNATISQDANVRVVIKDVVCAEDATDKLAEETFTSRMRDITAPVIFNAAATTSKTIVISTSEPLNIGTPDVFQVLANIKIGGNNLVGKLNQNFATSQITVELGTKLAPGTYSIEISGMADYVGFTAPVYTGEIVIVEDTTPPVLLSVEASQRDRVVLTFNEPIASLGTITINGNTIISGVQSGDLKSYTITLSNPLTLGALVQQNLTYVGTTDMEGNAVATTQTFAFQATDDLTVPTATIALVNNEIRITYSKDMSDYGKVNIIKADGTNHRVDLVPTAHPDNAKIGIVSAAAAGFDSAAAAANYTIELTAAKDNSLRQNQIAKTTAVVSVVDITAPRLGEVVIARQYNAGPPAVHAQVRVYFNEAMDTTTLTTLTNYLVRRTGDSTPIQLSAIPGAAATASADAKSVLLTIPGDTVAAGSTEIYVLGVKDAAGNFIHLDDFNVLQVVAANAPSFTFNANEATSRNQIVLEFSNPIATFVPSDVLVKNTAGSTISLVGVAYTLSADGKEVTVTLSGNLDANASLASEATTATVSLRTANITDIYGQKLFDPATIAETVPVSIVDAIAPSATSIRATHAAGITTVVINLSENLDLNDGDAIGAELSQFVVLNKGVVQQIATSLYNDAVPGTSPARITLTFTGGAVGDSVNVKFFAVPNSTIEDLLGNELANFDLTFTTVTP